VYIPEVAHRSGRGREGVEGGTERRVGMGTEWGIQRRK